MEHSEKSSKQIDWKKTYVDCNRAVRSVIGNIVGFGNSSLKDMISETFEKGMKFQHQYDPAKGGSVKTWLCQIGKNIALMSFKKKKDLPILIEFEYIEDELDYTDEVINRLMEILESIPDSDTKETFLQLASGKTYDELSIETGICPATLRTRIMRFRNLLDNNSKIKTDPLFDKYRTKKKDGDKMPPMRIKLNKLEINKKNERENIGTEK